MKTLKTIGLLSTLLFSSLSFAGRGIDSEEFHQARLTPQQIVEKYQLNKPTRSGRTAEGVLQNLFLKVLNRKLRKKASSFKAFTQFDNNYSCIEHSNRVVRSSIATYFKGQAYALMLVLNTMNETKKKRPQFSCQRNKNLASVSLRDVFCTLNFYEQLPPDNIMDLGSGLLPTQGLLVNLPYFQKNSDVYSEVSAHQTAKMLFDVYLNNYAFFLKKYFKESCLLIK